jgi:uncharacterized Zn finger protein (UPF0148 family)
MSDFDKEAERERLREKYEQEQAEREATEKMSELLLQGATMTNAHCSDCGDPIFRYDGQEFCASCEKAVDRDTGDESEDDQAAESDQQGGENIEVATPDDERVAFGGENAQDDPAAAEDQHPSQSPSAQASQPTEPTQSQQSGNGQRQPRQRSAEQEQSRQSPEQRRPEASASSQQPSRQPERTREVPSIEPSGSDDVSAARASLVRTLTRFSEQAEATDDPQRAREYLAAAREAAETLAVLRQ